MSVRTAGRVEDLPLVLFIDDVARLLGTSTRTIHRSLRARTFAIPVRPSVDRKPRWSRAAVLAFLEGAAATDSSRRRRVG